MEDVGDAEPLDGGADGGRVADVTANVVDASAGVRLDEQVEAMGVFPEVEDPDLAA